MTDTTHYTRKIEARSLRVGDAVVAFGTRGFKVPLTVVAVDDADFGTATLTRPCECGHDTITVTWARLATYPQVRVRRQRKGA